MSEDFFANKPLGTLATTQGEFLVFNITVGHQEQVGKDLGKPLDKCDPTDFARAMIKYTCQHAEPQASDAASPVPALATLEVQSFSAEDIEAFAKFYVENNQYLYRKFESENPDGLGEVVYPKQEKESFTTYLHRVSVLHEKEQIEIGRDMMKSMGVGAFSPTLSQRIENMVGMGSALKSFTQDFQAEFNLPQAKIISTNVPNARHLTEVVLETRRLEREAHLAPFRELGSKLDQIADHSAKSVDYMVETSTIQTQIAATLKTSADETSWYSRWSFRLNWVVIGISLLALTVPVCVTFHLANGDRKAQAARDQQLTNVVAALHSELVTVASAVSALQASQQTQNLALVDAIQKSTKDNSPQLQQLIQLQERVLKQSADSDAKKDQQAQQLTTTLQQLSATLATRPPGANQPGSATNTTPARK
jgi:hypothetical protein